MPERRTPIPIRARGSQEPARFRSARARDWRCSRSPTTPATPLTQACDYRIVGQTPPARLWTVALEDPDGRVVDGADGAAALGSDTLLRAPDGSFEIVLSAQAANAETGSPPRTRSASASSSGSTTRRRAPAPSSPRSSCRALRATAAHERARACTQGWYLPRLRFGGLFDVRRPERCFSPAPSTSARSCWCRCSRRRMAGRGSSPMPARISSAEIPDAGTSGAEGVAGLDPLFVNGACRIRLGEAPVGITVDASDRFWSVALYDPKGVIVFSLNDRTAVEGRLDMIVVNAAAERRDSRNRRRPRSRRRSWRRARRTT